MKIHISCKPHFLDNVALIHEVVKALLFLFVCQGLLFEVPHVHIRVEDFCFVLALCVELNLVLCGNAIVSLREDLISVCTEIGEDEAFVKVLLVLAIQEDLILIVNVAGLILSVVEVLVEAVAQPRELGIDQLNEVVVRQSFITGVNLNIEALSGFRTRVFLILTRRANHCTVTI